MTKNEVKSNPLNNSLADLARQTVKTEIEAAKAQNEKNPVNAWQCFCNYANEYNDIEGKSRGVTVWIDENLKATLDKIKTSGACNVPIRHLVSAAIRTFIEEHRTDILASIEKASKQSQSNSLL